MPYSTDTIVREESTLPGDITVITYTSPMLSGQTSVIYLINDPKNGFIAAYRESGE